MDNRITIRSIRQPAWQAAAELKRYAFRKMKYTVLAIALFPLSIWAENLCVPIASKGEGHWPIPEEEFTKENALRSANELMKILKDTKGEFISDRELGLDSDQYVMERLIMIKGYQLRSSAINDIALGEEYAKWTRKYFCDFLEKEALAWH